MPDKIGRNDLCPCGSGLKHKKCCVSKGNSNVSFLDFAWQKVRKTEASVVDNHLFPYVTKELPKNTMEMAYADFYPKEAPKAMDKDLLFNNFFIPWMLFDWIPLDDLAIEGFDPNIALVQNYVRKHGTKLSDTERRFIEAMDSTYYSFYNVLEVEFEKSLLIKDIILGTSHTIKEKAATRSLKRGDVVFTRILTLDEQSIFIGMAPFSIPARYNIDLINFRKWLIEEGGNKKLSPALLRNEFAMELLDYYFEIVETGFNNPFPTLCNTDGDPIQISKSYFSLSISPEEALKKLLPLTLADSSEDSLDNTQVDKSGRVQKIEFSWLKKGNKKHKDWNTTVMGRITLEKDKLVLETNSDERMQQGKELIVKYLDGAARFERTIIENIEKMLKSTASKELKKSSDETDLLNFPEAQEQIKGYVKKHWENWFDESLRQ